MYKKIILFLFGEIIVGVALPMMFNPFLGHLLLRFLRLSLSITYYIFMYMTLVSYKNKYLNVFLLVYFLSSIYFITNTGNLSLFQWVGYKLGRYIFNIL